MSSRRAVLAAGCAVIAKAAAPVWRARQFHNQPEDSHQHRFLVDLWEEVRRETRGRMEVTVHAQNGGVAGSDPAALRMLVAGELEFFTLMGGILGQVVPVAEIQGLPFAFRSNDQVQRTLDGRLGEYLRAEMEAKGIRGFRNGLLENGFRHISMIAAPVRTVADLADRKIRVPDGEMFRDFFSTLGARPVTVNIRDLYGALQTGRVDGQENPLVVSEVNRLYEVTRYMSLTSHMWSGFNQLANLSYWRGLPADVQASIERSVAKHVTRQRRYTQQWNARLEKDLVRRGMMVNRADVTGFRGPLGPFYSRWRERVGQKAWNLLEAEVGPLG